MHMDMHNASVSLTILPSCCASAYTIHRIMHAVTEPVFKSATMIGMVHVNGGSAGRQYVGSWKDGYKHGAGTYTWPNGNAVHRLACPLATNSMLANSIGCSCNAYMLAAQSFNLTPSLLKSL